MKSSYKPISELVERIDIRNSDGDAAILMGLSIDKCFIHSVANTVGTDLTKYKVICKNQFAVSLMQVSRDSKIPVACFREYDRAIMSPAYSIFQVADESVVLPDYLDMWFKRPEFDREAAFVAVGGVRGSMPWEEFARIKVHVPTLERQRKIVDAYKAVNERIHIKQQLNDNLEATGLAIFKEKFSSPNDGFDETPLYDLAEYINGTSFSEDEYSSDGLPIIKIAELKDGITSATQYFVGNKDTKYLIHDSDVLFSWSGNPDTSIDAFIWSHGDGILNQHTFRMVPRYGVAFTYFMLKFCKPEFVKAAMGKQTTGLGHVTVKDLKRLTLPLNEETAFLFNQAAMPLYEQIFKNLKEINVLIELKNQTVQMLSIINH